MIKACIFDLDGVLVDTARFHYLAWKRLATMLGFDFTQEDNEQLKGISRMESLEILLRIGKLNLSVERKLELAEIKNNWYVEDILKMTEDDILPGVKSFLIELKNHGYKIGLGSASKNARTILSGVKLEPLFDCIIDGTKVTHAKPNPEIFLKGIDELHIKPEECVVFEDAAAGIEAALKGGMVAIGVGSSNILHEAHLVIPGFEDMNITIFENFLRNFLNK